MGADGETQCDSEGQAIRAPRKSIDESLCFDQWEVVPDFPEVPAHLLADDRWQNVSSDRWAYPESIQILEAGALVRAAERMANCGPLVDCRALILGDNMAATLSFGRWRARKFKLIVQLRRAACLGLAQRN